MKEQQIIVDIDPSGKITADAEGFSGDACLQELEKLLGDLSSGVAQVKRKTDGKHAHIAAMQTQTIGKNR